MRTLLEHTLCSSVTEWHQQALSIISSLNKYTTDGDVQNTPVYIKQGDLMLVSGRLSMGTDGLSGKRLGNRQLTRDQTRRRGETLIYLGYLGINKIYILKDLQASS